MVADPHGNMMSVEEYLELDRNSVDVRYEYIDGHIYMMSGGMANHAIISANIIRELGNLLRRGPCRVYTSDMRVQLSETRYVYPDVSVSCDMRDRGQVETLRYPRLIVEVLSPSTRGYDRFGKFAYYRACPTVEEYVLVDTRQQAIEVYRRASDNVWTLHPLGSEDDVELASLNIHFPVGAVYEDALLPDDIEDNSST
jgi:Uma2 family endonuclease